MIEIFRGSNIESKNIRNLLESRNIYVFVLNQLMSSIEPWVISPGGNKPTILKVNKCISKTIVRFLKVSLNIFVFNLKGMLYNLFITCSKLI